MSIEILPSKKTIKLFAISLIIVLVLNIGEFFSIDGTPKFIAYLIDTFLYTLIVMVTFRVITWVVNKLK